jgi:hypothetical protein
LGHTISHGEAPKQTLGKLCLMSFTTQPEAPVLFSKPPAGAQVLAAACSTQMANAIILIGVTIATLVVAFRCCRVPPQNQWKCDPFRV